jgi:predicted nucleotidyltransferase
MRTRSRLAESLWPKGRRRVLGLLLANPDQQWHLRDLARTTNLAPATVQREVTGLHRAGILSRQRTGRQVYYRANRDCPIFYELRGIVIKTLGPAELLGRLLGEFGDQVQLALIFGSLARGEDSPESDVDLLVIGSLPVQSLTAPLREAEAELAREINPVVMRSDELARRVASGDHLVGAIMRDPKLFLIGDEDELGRLAQAG